MAQLNLMWNGRLRKFTGLVETIITLTIFDLCQVLIHDIIVLYSNLPLELKLIFGFIKELIVLTSVIPKLIKISSFR